MQAGFELDICSNTIDVVFHNLQRATSKSTVTKESQTISKEIRGELRGTSGSDCTSRRCLSHENTRLGFTRLINRKASGRMSFGQMRKHRSVLEISSNQLRVHRCKKLNMYLLYILWNMKDVSCTGCLESVLGTMKFQDHQGILQWNVLLSVRKLGLSPQVVDPPTVIMSQNTQERLRAKHWTTYGAMI